MQNSIKGALFNIGRKLLLFFAIFILYFIFYILSPLTADAATLSVDPPSGTYEAGDTFDASIFLNTEGQEINTVVADLAYPPDMLQIVSSGSGTSIIKFWTTPPEFNNQQGLLRLSGGIPNGVNTRNGLVATLTFRVKKTGTAPIRFVGDTQTYLNDGNGTEALSNTFSGVYTLVLPPPEGPIVRSDTHPSQSVWYRNPNIILRWENEFEDDGYSYVLDKEPTTLPDDISEGQKRNVTYKDMEDGTHYFHVKALRNGIWGGVTHFAVNIDTTEPADFPIKVLPSKRTTSPRPTFEWGTTDEFSGIDFYELKIVPLTPGANEGTEQLFIEANSPYLTKELNIGEYDLIIRAHDKAGNTRTVTERFRITESVFKFISEDGITVGDRVIMPWWVFFLILITLVGALTFFALRAYREHEKAKERFATAGTTVAVPPEVKDKLDELNKFQDKYGKTLVVALAALSILFAPAAIAQEDVADTSVQAEEEHIELNPPVVESVAQDITNEEIFYIGGFADTRDMDIVIYLQNLWTGETIQRTVATNDNREWFYRHHTFLNEGVYLVWTQGKLHEQASPPSSQIQVTVESTAFTFGASRISHKTLYLVASIMLLLATAGLTTFIVHHRRQAKRKHAHIMKEIREAEESIRRGFGILRKDIEAELAILKKAKFNKTLSKEKEGQEEQLMKDLEEIERKIGKEVWDIKDVENK